MAPLLVQILGGDVAGIVEEADEAGKVGSCGPPSHSSSTHQRSLRPVQLPHLHACHVLPARPHTPAARVLSEPGSHLAVLPSFFAHSSRRATRCLP